MPTRRSVSGDGGASPPSYSSTTNAAEHAERRRHELERQISAGHMRLRSGSSGHKPLKNEDPDMDDEEHEPIEVYYTYVTFCVLSVRQ